MSESFHICIDESGDPGFEFNHPDCSRWFLLAAVVLLADHVPIASQVVRAAKLDIGWQLKKHLHFKKVKGASKRATVMKWLTSEPQLYRSICVLVDKHGLDNPEVFRDENRLYFFFTRYLLERASWLCRDSKEARLRKHGDGTARVVFSNMNEVSKDRIAEYFWHLQERGADIDWSVIRPKQFDTLSPGRHPGLQIADCVAGAFSCPSHRCGDRRTVDWVRTLKPMMYRGSRGKYLGYGVKFFPKDAEKKIAQGALAPWAIDTFCDERPGFRIPPILAAAQKAT